MQLKIKRAECPLFLYQPNSTIGLSLIYSYADLNLLKAGANPNVQDETCKVSPLHLAVLERNFEALKSLIKAGGDVNLQDNKGDSALYAAVGVNFEHAAIFLINDRARFHLKNDRGETPYQLAQNHPDILEPMDAIESRYP